MSNSFKKHKVIKDKSNSKGKKIGSRKFRRNVKNNLQVHIISEDTIFPKDKSEVINDYDVCDYKIYLEQKGFWKGYVSYFLKGKLKKLFK